MTDDRKPAIEHALKRRAGMEPVQRQALVKSFENADDLYGTCQQCQRRVKGTMGELNEHAAACTGKT